jgi:3-oxoacyl-[acyl-carrier-protein] synthase II
MGAINPLGNTIGEIWDGLLEGKSGVRLAKNTDLNDYHIKIAGEIDLPDIKEYFNSPKMRKRLDRYILLGHVAGKQALADSGLEPEKGSERIGVIIGTGDGGLSAHLDNIPKITKDGMHTASLFYVLSAIPNTATAFFAQEAKLHGPSFSINSACATSNHVIGVATLMIKMGLADAIFAGGAEAVVNQAGIAAFGNIMALSDRNDSPETASRPFDVDRDGFVLSEGAAVLCLEDLEHAKKRGAKIYGEISGFGFTSDAHDLVAPHPEAKGASSAMEIALKTARLNPDDIGLVNAHGTSTPVGDKVEGIAVNNTFGSYGREVPVHSTKSMTGHLIGAAGATEVMAGILAFEKGLIHKSANLFKQDPEIDLNIVTETMEDNSIDHIMSNGFGFGGHNSSVIVSRFKD